MNAPKTIIVMGRSGSGKGTQIELLKKQLISVDKEVYHFESGHLFRQMVKGDGYTSDRLREILKKGQLVPDFLTDWLLVGDLVQNLDDPEQVLILDGYPRTLHQVDTLDRALDYYNRAHDVVVLHIEVSEAEVRRRMAERGRTDDIDMEAVENRITFYNEKVLPSLELLREKEQYKVYDIDGEGAVESIHESIKEILER
ncbi:MAG: nucleoside monophosphate kinase [Candidatus Pacebacteria bacterium]|nr:nucleoside monophosphate kinase [Candidatus Paceibacterota bacterium]